MSDSIHNIQVLFVNGVNTCFGGSVAESNKIWQASFIKNGIKFCKLDTVPTFRLRQNRLAHKFLLSIYFLPGTLFRIFKVPIFEFFYKISPFSLIIFSITNLIKRPKKVLFSHHSTYYLAIFCWKFKRVFLIHDLMYVRARSRGASRKVQRLNLFFELFIYRLAPIILVQSYQEWRVLKKFLKRRIFLIACCDLSLNNTMLVRQSGIAVVSDWRRPENIHGALKFFNSVELKKNEERNMACTFYGFNSGSIVNKLNLKRTSSTLDILNGGIFNGLDDISESYFLVPIYQGAGIKRKTVTALSAGRIVIGTDEAFVGLPPWIISNVIKRVKSIVDLNKLPNMPSDSEFEKVLQKLSKQFYPIGELHELW